MTAISSPNRRRSQRLPIRLRARCLYHIDGRTRESDMWVIDVNESGILLESVDPAPDRPAFRQGKKIDIRDLFYDDRGGCGLEGVLRWAVRDEETERWRLGVRFADAQDMSLFRDFLEIVKFTPKGLAA